jgi:hypothetical protein
MRFLCGVSDAAIRAFKGILVQPSRRAVFAKRAIRQIGEANGRMEWTACWLVSSAPNVIVSYA